MTIDAATLDDIDSQTTLQFYDSSEISWNGRTLELLSDSLQSCLEVLSLQFPSMPQALSAKPIVHLHIDSSVTTAAQPILTPSIEPSEWAAAQHLVKGYLRTAHLPKEILASASEITGSISLQDLLSPEWFNHPIIPFNIPQEVPFPISPFTLTLPPLTQLELMNIPLTLDLQAFSALYAHSQPLPGDLLKPPRGFSSLYPDEYYVRIQSEYYDKLQADCYNKLLAVQQAQIAALPNLPVPVVVAPPIDLHAIAAAKALATPLPLDLVRPPGHSRRNHQHYSKLQAEYYAKVEAECYANLVAEQQAQIAVVEAAPLPDPIPSNTEQFVSFVEGKLAEAADPSYTAQFARPAYNEQFVAIIESKLAELKDPAYAEQFGRPLYNQQFVAQLESKLGAYQVFKAEERLLKAEERLLQAQQEYAAGVRMIGAFFGAQPIGLPQFLSEETVAPLCEIPLLGHPNQPTVNFHCGIANSFSSVIEGGVCLCGSLERNFAVQPHLIHSDIIVEGLALVATEKVNVCAPYIDPVLQVLISGVYNVNGFNLEKLTEMALDNSQIQKSIDYELANLSSTAQNIIKIGNPNLKQVHVTFSNGGYVFREALKQLSPEYRETIVVITAGTTAIIESDMACKVFNIIGDKDYASKICNGWTDGIEKAKAHSSVEVIEQREVLPRINGHYFIQDEYQDRISEILKSEIAKTYEIY